MCLWKWDESAELHAKNARNKTNTYPFQCGVNRTGLFL